MKKLALTIDTNPYYYLILKVIALLSKNVNFKEKLSCGWVRN